MSYAKGFIGARWRAADRNGDTMQYKVELKGAAENEWKLLKDKLTVKNISWDASAFSDGEYNLRVTASDQASNPEGQGLSGNLISEPFIVDNTPPSVTALATSVTGSKVKVTFKASDLLSLIDTTERALLLVPDIVPTLSLAEFAGHGAQLNEAAFAADVRLEATGGVGKLALVELQNGDAAPSYVAGTSNFYAVTRYNWSSYYALAVIELGEAVAREVARTAR